MLGRVREAGLVALLALVVIPAGVVRAHEHIPVGPYVLVIGWVHEPVYTGQPNGLDLLIKLEGEPAAEGTADAGHAADTGGVEDVAATIKFAVEYGGERKEYDVRPMWGRPGHYTADLMPMLAGTYTFFFSGSIKGEDLEIKFEPQEVVAQDTISFPAAADPGALAAGLAALRQLNLPALGAGGLGVLLGAAALLRRK